MTTAPLLDDEVREVLRLHESGIPQVEIAAQFQRTEAAISHLVNRKTYRHITDPTAHNTKGPCSSCPDCVKKWRRDENSDRGYAATASGLCMECGAETETKVTQLVGRPERVKCERHSGRRR